MKKSCVRIIYDSINECSVGCSKIGGRPDLPPDFQWFYIANECYNGEVEYVHLSFLAQINCEEAHPYDKNNLLPKEGLLYFFYATGTMAWGSETKDRGSARVYYYPGDISTLVRTEFPPDIKIEDQFPELPITFSSKEELPSFEEFIEQWSDVQDNEWTVYNETKIKMGFESEFDDEVQQKRTKLLGYADVIQNSMLLECEQIMHQINNVKYTNTSKDLLYQQRESSKQWQLLFQLDTIYIENQEIMMWGDMGRLFYYIKHEDLKNLNFDNCWCILQC